MNKSKRRLLSDDDYLCVIAGSLTGSQTGHSKEIWHSGCRIIVDSCCTQRQFRCWRDWKSYRLCRCRLKQCQDSWLRNIIFFTRLVFVSLWPQILHEHSTNMQKRSNKAEVIDTLCMWMRQISSSYFHPRAVLRPYRWISLIVSLFVSGLGADSVFRLRNEKSRVKSEKDDSRRFIALENIM